MEASCILPADALCRVLSYSSAKDVIRWRVVSRLFRAITYRASIWRDLYANSCLSRPPGPFPFQSAAYLEEALVKAEKVARAWMTKPMRGTSSVELRVEQQPAGPIKLLAGKWVIGCESGTRVVLYDAATLSEQRRRVIWEHEEPVETWDVGSVTSEEGQCLLYVLLSHEDPDIPWWRLLELRMNNAQGQLYNPTVFNIPKYALDLEVKLESGSSPFLCIPGERLVFDTRTRIFYDFPEFRISLKETRDYVESKSTFRSTPESFVLTKTHVIVLYRYSSSPGVLFTVIQAFTVPPEGSSDGNGKGTMRLSHEGVLDHRFDHVTLLRNSKVDRTTGSTNVRLLEHDFNRQLYVINGLTLPGSSSDEVLAITMIEEIKESTKLREYRLGDCPPCVDCSDDGHLRGFYIARYEDVSQGESMVCPILKFTVDASQDECTLAFGELSLPEWNRTEGPGYVTDVCFDGARGRLCFVKSADPWELVAVVDVVDIE